MLPATTCLVCQVWLRLYLDSNATGVEEISPLKRARLSSTGPRKQPLNARLVSSGRTDGRNLLHKRILVSLMN